MQAPGGGRRHLASGTLVPLESLPVLPGTEDERVVRFNPIVLF
jgi:hypothetical protein